MSLENSSGRNVTAPYGPRSVQSKYGGEFGSSTPVKTATWTFNYDDLPVGGATGLEFSLPANSVIVSAKVRIITAFNGTTPTLNVGLEQSDGTDIDVDGLAAAATASVVGVVVGAGALVGKSIGAAAGELIVANTAGDSTAGKAQVLVEYILA